MYKTRLISRTSRVVGNSGLLFPELDTGTSAVQVRGTETTLLEKVFLNVSSNLAEDCKSNQRSCC